MFPVIREVITIDPMVRGAVKKYEVVDVDNYDMLEPISSHWTEQEAYREAMSLLD